MRLFIYVFIYLFIYLLLLLLLMCATSESGSGKLFYFIGTVIYWWKIVLNQSLANHKKKKKKKKKKKHVFQRNCRGRVSVQQCGRPSIIELSSRPKKIYLPYENLCKIVLNQSLLNHKLKKTKEIAEEVFLSNVAVHTSKSLVFAKKTIIALLKLMKIIMNQT